MSIEDGFERMGSDPFELPLEKRDHIRRFRGRIPMPVTIWTANGNKGGPKESQCRPSSLGRVTLHRFLV